MSTYSEQAFDSSHYDSARPTYPDQFYRSLVDYHKQVEGNETSLAMNVGTGPGFVAFQLTKHFDHVIGTDLSPTMIDTCNARRETVPQKDRLRFYTAPAENAPATVAPLSVDVITAAEACHWMDHKKFFAECARILKPNGTLPTGSIWSLFSCTVLRPPRSTESITGTRQLRPRAPIMRSISVGFSNSRATICTATPCQPSPTR